MMVPARRARLHTQHQQAGLAPGKLAPDDQRMP